MLVVSNAFNEAFKSDLREVKMRIKINDVTYTDEDIISFNFNSGSIVGETFAIGSTYANSIKLTLCKIVEGLKQLDEVMPEMGIVLPGGGTEYVKLGTFLISEEVNPDRNENRTSLECTDRMLMLDDFYESKLKYPAQIREVALEIANLAGVEVDKVSFGRLRQDTIKQPIGYTYREAIGLIAQFEAGYATFDRNGLLAIRLLEDKDYRVTPDEYFLKGLVKNELMFRPAGIQVSIGDEEEKFLSIGNKKGSVIKLENKLMTETLLRSIYEKVKTVNYYPYSLNWRGNPAVEAGDWLRVTDTKGNQFKVPNLSYSLEYKGGLTATSTVETVASNEVKMGYKTILEQTIEYVNESIKDNGTEISYGVEEPPNPKEGDVWFKYNGPDTEIWIYEKIGEPDIFDWVLKISSAVDDTIKEKIEELEQTSKDISESVDKALEEAGIARQEAFNSDKLANEAKKDALDAVEKGNKNSIDITKTDNQLKVSAVKIEENTTRITNIKIESDRLSSVMLETQDSLESLKLSSDRNFILGTSDEYKNVNFDGSSTGPTDPEPSEKIVDVQVTGYDEYYNTLYTETVKAAEGSDKTFYAKSVTGYEIVGQTSKTVKVSSYTKVVFEYKKTGSGGGTPTKKVDVKVQCFDERSLVINSYIEKHEVNTYVTFVAKDINDYDLTSSRTQEIYVNENSIVKFNYKKKEGKPPISTIGDNILTGSEKETEIRGAYSSPMEYILYSLAKPANQSGIATNDMVQVEFEVVSKNISVKGGQLQFGIDDSANLSNYISIDDLPTRGKYTGTFRISGSNPQNSTTRSVVVRTKDFKTGNSIRIKNLTIQKTSGGGSGGGTPSKEVDVKVQCIDEKGIVINSYIESHTINTYVKFAAKDINDYVLTSSRTQEIYVNENSVVKFNYKKKEETIISNIVKNPERELTITGGDSNPTERYLCDAVATSDKLNLKSGDYVDVQFEMTQYNISGTDGMLQFAIRDGVELSYYININSIPKSGKFRGTFRVGRGSTEEVPSNEIVVRVRDFPAVKSIKIKNLSIQKTSQTRMNLQLFSNSLSGLVKIGQIDIDERFSNEPNFLVSCYVDADYDVGLEIILKNSWGSEINRIKSKDSKRSGFLECEVPYSQNVKMVEVYLANRSNYNYNKGRYKWLQGEIGNERTPWKLAVEDLASKTKVSSLEQTVDGFQMNVNNSLDGMNGQLTVMSNQINTTVNKFETVNGKVSKQESKITQLSNQLDFKVSANEVVSRINMSPERVRIDSKLIHLSGQTLIDDAVIKNAMIANGAIDNAKIQNATISDAKIISITANKVVARDLSAITTNTGTLNISGWMSILTDNMGIRGSFDYGDMSDTATFQRWHEGDFSISHRILAFKGHQWKLRTNGTKGAYHGWSESTYGMNHFKSRLYTNSSTTSLIGRVDIRDDFIQVNDNWVTNETSGTWIKPNYIVATSARLYDVSAKPSVNYVYFNEFRKDLADFRIGKDGVGKAVVSDAIYKRTYNSQPTMCVTDEGRLGRIVSAKKYKDNIEVADDVISKSKTVLSIEPKSWTAKNSDSGIRHYGFIADDFHESDLKEVVLYSHDEVEGLSYDRITMYHNVVLSEHEKEIESLKRRIEKLEEELDHAS